MVGSGPRVTRALTIHEDGAVEAAWSWSPDDFAPDSLFAPELSVGAPVAVTAAEEAGAEVVVELDPPVEIWRYPIVTTSKCPDGFEEIEQGTSITPRWPASEGRARLLLRPATGPIPASG